MTMHLFNPPEPGGQPTIPRDELTLHFQQSGCGTCQCVPKYWKITGVQNGGFSAYTQLFMSQVLLRDLPRWDHDNLCQWTCTFDLFAATGSHEFGSIILTTQGFLNTWGIWFYGLTRTPPGVDDISLYSLDYGLPAAQQSPFRCLSPNTFGLLPNGSGNFQYLPATITITPFWP